MSVTRVTERLSDSAAQVLNLLISGDHLSRPDLSARLKVTAPTITTALRELAQGGFVIQTGSRQGRLGRSAAMYGLDARSGWLLGIDIGSTQVLIVARSLNGTLLSDFRYSLLETDRAGGEVPLSLTEVACQRIADHLAKFTSSHGRLRAVGIAVAHVVPHSPSIDSMIGLGGDAVRLGDILDDLGLPEGVPVLLENNVNCAALAEMTLGVAQSAENFVYLQVGVRVGAGLVVDGKLRRGEHGGSGELSTLPFPMVSASESEEQSFLLEEHLGSEHLLERARNAWPISAGPPPNTTKELIDMAHDGNEPSLEVVRHHAIDVARLAMLVIAVIDPGLIVLGGGVGQNPILAQIVEKLIQEQYPHDRLDVSALGDRATVEGAAVLAIEDGRSALLGDHYMSRLGDQSMAIVHVDGSRTTAT